MKNNRYPRFKIENRCKHVRGKDYEESLAHLDDEAMLDTVNDWMDILDVMGQFDDDFSAAEFFMTAETATGPAQTIIRELPGN